MLRPRSIRHFINRMTARHGRLRVNVTIGWLMLCIVTVITTLAVSMVFTRPALFRLMSAGAVDVHHFANQLLLLHLILLLVLAGFVYGILHFGVVVPIESFRKNAKGMLGDHEEKSAQAIGLSYELRRRTDQLEAALDDNELQRERVSMADEKANSHLATTQNLVSNLSDLVAYVNTDGRVVEISPLTCEFLQLHRSTVIGNPFNESFTLFDCYRDNPREYPLNYVIDDVLKQRSSVPRLFEALLVTARKEERKVTLRTVCALSTDGVPIGVVIRILSNTGLSVAPEVVPIDAKRMDPVTGLGSEEMFDLRMREIIDIARSQKISHALLLCSPDNLASIIEAHGLRAGNEVLWRTARLLEDHVPGDVELYRVGLDVIGLLCPFSDLARQGDLADRICHAGAARQFVWGEKQHDSSLSIGGVEVDSLSEGVEPLLQKAHRALISARHAGGGLVQLNVPDEILTRRRLQDDDWVSWLMPRLEGGFAHLSSQSILPISGNALKRPMFEVFIRIEDDDGVWITPDFYMPALERRQLSHKLDLWVIEQTLKEMAGNKSLTEDYECACINLSGWSLCEPGFGDQVHALVSRYGVPPSNLCFEITEQQVASHLSETLRFMRTVKPLGVRFSLDRYRAMGGLHGLKDAPLDFVKIHPSLTAALRMEPPDPVELLHLSWVNKVCLARGITTVALGIEHEQIVRVLKSLDIQYAQGVALNKIGPVIT